MLNRFRWVFVVLFLLEVVFLKIFDHFLASGSQLTVELDHGHVLNDQIVGTSALLILLIV
jgi:hypothetical protein